MLHQFIEQVVDSLPLDVLIIVQDQDKAPRELIDLIDQGGRDHFQ